MEETSSQRIAVFDTEGALLLDAILSCEEVFRVDVGRDGIEDHQLLAFVDELPVDMFGVLEHEGAKALSLVVVIAITGRFRWNDCVKSFRFECGSHEIPKFSSIDLVCLVFVQIEGLIENLPIGTLRSKPKM